MATLKTAPLTELLTTELSTGKHGAAGDFFPTVRELSERFHASPVTIQRTVTALTGKGLLRREGRRMKISCLTAHTRLRIGVAVTQMDNPFFSRLLNELEKEGARRGIEILVAGSAYDVVRERRILAMFSDSGADGLLICPAHDIKSAPTLQKAQLPFVLIGHQVNGVNAPSVEVDHFRAGEIAADHLFSRGCRDFFYVGGNNFIRDERCEGYGAGLARLGFQLTAEHILRSDSENHQEMLPEILRKLYSGKPTGIFCYHDLWALRVLRAAHFCRLKVPDELAVMGMDDLPIAAETLPSLSSIAYPLNLIASETLNQLESLHAGMPCTRQRILLEPNLIPRSSTHKKEELWR